MKIKVSLVSINYKVEKELIACISSIVESKPKISYEIIVVDNDEKNTIEKNLKEKFPEVKYIKSPSNIGYGAGNNLGAKHASGEFIFFLNPDTILTKGSIDSLYNFLKNKPESGMIAPLLLNPKGEAYPLQGSDSYTFLSAIVILSFINKLFPYNTISNKFFHRSWNKKDNEEFDVVPGTAFMIKKSIFEKAGMFDEKFFLYFEEYDLAKRVKNLGYKNYIIPKSKVLHIWEASTKKRKDINEIFSKSRYLFFKKHYGILTAFIINVILGFGKYEFMLGLILVLSVYLGSFKIKELMVFIGDQGWFYLSARDIILDGNVPLVGIASSHPWLHQGALWTYMLAFFLWIFNFDPVSGAYLTIILGILSVIGIYIVGSKFFSKRAGLIASLLYATSPLVVYNMRFPYHTTPIPVFVIGLIFSLHKIIQNKLTYLPLSIFLLGVLYSFEIATAVLWPVVIGVLGYKLYINKITLKEIFNKKNLILSAIALVISLFPMILYDVRNGYPQTLKFAAWIFYKAISFLGYNSQHEFSTEKIIIMFNFLFDNFTKLIFAQNSVICLLILIIIVGWAICVFFKKSNYSSHKLISLLFFIPLIFVVLNQVPSDAYLPIFFPIVILIFSSFIDFIMNKKMMFVSGFIFIVILAAVNINYMFKNDFLFAKSSKLFTLDKRVQATNSILNVVQNKDYNLIGKGPGSEHASFTMNYEYLTWWLKKPPSKKHEKLQFEISETERGIIVKKVTR